MITSQRSGFPLDCPQYISPMDTFSDQPIGPNLPPFGFEFDQHEGEILFIPSGWAHQVSSFVYN